MTNGAADDTPEYIAAPLVARNYAINDEKRTRANVIGNNLQRVVRQITRAACIAITFPSRRLDQLLKQIDFIIAVNLLHYRGNTLQPHACVHGRLGQRMQCPGAVPVVLHEYQVPDFNIAVAVRVGCARRAACNLGTVVIKNFGTRTARPGIAHLPEIIHGSDAREARWGDTYFVEPDIRCFVILGIHCDP